MLEGLSQTRPIPRSSDAEKKLTLDLYEACKWIPAVYSYKYLVNKFKRSFCEKCLLNESKRSFCTIFALGGAHEWSSALIDFARSTSKELLGYETPLCQQWNLFLKENSKDIPHHNIWFNIFSVLRLSMWSRQNINCL